MSEKPNLRERTRRAMQKEIGEAALDLFVERGYEATTVDDIAAAVGMSKRSVFRYFAGKEDIVVGKFDLGADLMLEILRDRPDDEPLWSSLRRLLDIADERDGARSRRIQRMIFETPALLAVYLQRLQHFQNVIVEGLAVRAGESGKPYAADDPTPRALTAAAFGCLVAAQYAWLAAATDEPLAEYIDRAMATLVPRL
jgi:AcrR family transcriptional regulator